MGGLLKLDIVAVAEGCPDTAEYSERSPLVIALGNWNSEILVFWVPGPLLNQLSIESSPERS